MSIKVGVIGCGSWGRNHARVYKQLPIAELGGVADLNPAVAREIGEMYRVPYYADPDKVVTDPDIQLISICTPTITHADLGLRALEEGKDVLVEKPMANSVDEARALIRAAEKHHQHLTVGFVERFNPAVIEVYKQVGEGRIGDVILAHSRRVSRSPGRIGDVGVVKDLAIHDIDIINHLLGVMPESVSAVAGKIKHRYEDYANINMLYADDRNAFVETNWLTPRRVRTLTVTGTEGIINVEYTTQQITVDNDEMMIQPYLPYKEPLMEELRSFVQRSSDDAEPEITGLDGLNALRVCEAALESSETRMRVSLS
ncbi:MAG: Gfo/Idh/MocA family oxidoreductase [Candidatus Bathyarchaeia archaeon]|jgi:UDP-N-acetylglucosamine 3-dehydrogenase